MTTLISVSDDALPWETPALDELLASLAAGSSERQKREESPFAAVDLVRNSRLGALPLPVEYGGFGATPSQLLSFVIDLSEADPIVAHILRSHWWQVNEIVRSAPGSQRDRWIAEIRDGKIFANATSELSTVSAGATEYSTTLTQDGTSHLLNGEKFYSTGTMFADWIVVYAQVTSDTVASIIVPTPRAGIVIRDDWDGIGQRNTGSGTTIFDNVVVEPDEFRLFDSDAEVSGGSDVPFLQLYLQAITAGILRSVVTDASTLLHSRTRSFAHAPSPVPAADPILQECVGHLASSAFAAEATVLAAAHAIDAVHRAEKEGRTDPKASVAASLAAAKTKVHVDRIGLEAASALFEVGGASAASQTKNLDRHWRNIRTLTLHNPASYKALAIGDHVVNGTSLPATYF